MLGQRLKALRAARQISQKDLAAQLFVSPQAVGKWEREEATPNPETVRKLSELFDVSADYLLGRELSPNASPASHALRVPVLGVIQAGIPMDAIEDILDWEEVPVSWASGGREYFGLRVKGDSMYPKYLEGDTVILRKDSACDTGDDCAVLVNGDAATLKQVLLREDGAVELRPVNPTYPPRTYSPAEIESLPVQIIGVVVELRRKIK
ncbi:MULTISPECIES: LexA family protein [unclassified Flavonifractor]|uniref:LexA family protein n=1 Tax=unclassified Flavonifractor TaxID=2629267 RepID=UPI0013A5FAE0|nr:MULTISPECIES: XRE family transcriptional regulator [unclassified Flavonifractor]HIZ93708.1 XRE family transcriptional regulator [Candidatus Flavonifractor avicola]